MHTFVRSRVFLISAIAISALFFLVLGLGDSIQNALAACPSPGTSYVSSVRNVCGWSDDGEGGTVMWQVREFENTTKPAQGIVIEWSSTPSTFNVDRHAVGYQWQPTSGTSTSSWIDYYGDLSFLKPDTTYQYIVWQSGSKVTISTQGYVCKPGVVNNTYFWCDSTQGKGVSAVKVAGGTFKSGNTNVPTITSFLSKGAGSGSTYGDTNTRLDICSSTSKCSQTYTKAVFSNKATDVYYTSLLSGTVWHYNSRNDDGFEWYTDFTMDMYYGTSNFDPKFLHTTQGLKLIACNANGCSPPSYSYIYLGGTNSAITLDRLDINGTQYTSTPTVSNSSLNLAMTWTGSPTKCYLVGVDTSNLTSPSIDQNTINCASSVYNLSDLNSNLPAGIYTFDIRGCDATLDANDRYSKCSLPKRYTVNYAPPPPPPTFTMQYYSDSSLTTLIPSSGTANPRLKAGTYYVKITSTKSLSGTPVVSIDAEGTVNDITNGATTVLSGTMNTAFVYTRTIASTTSAIGATIENWSVTGTDTSGVTATNVNPTNESSKAAFTDTVAPTFAIQYYSSFSGSSFSGTLGDNPRLVPGTYYVKIEPFVTLNGTTPTVSINAEGTANDVINGTTVATVAGGNIYKYIRIISEDTAAVGAVLEDWSVTGTDAAGNASTNVNPTNEATKAAYTGLLDTTAPTVTQVTPISAFTNDATPNYTFNTNEAGTISYTGDCISSTSAAVAGNNTITFNTLAQGSHSNCTIKVTDSGGNSSNVLSVPSFIVDTTPPIATQTSPTDGAVTANTTVIFSADASDTGSGIQKVEFYIEGSLIQADTTSPYGFVIAWNSQNPEKTRTAYVRAYDNAGNITTTPTFTFTTIPPPVITSQPVDMTVNVGEPASFSVTATGSSKTTRTYEWSKSTNNGFSWTPIAGATSPTYTISPTALSDNNSQYKVRVLNVISATTGSSGVTSNVVTLTVNTSAPTVSITSPTQGAIISGTTATISADASDDVGIAGVQFKLDGTTNIGSEDTTAPYQVSWNLSGISDGSHNLTAIARDTEGNFTTSTVITIIVDKDNIYSGSLLVSGFAWNSQIGWIKQRGIVGDALNKQGNYGVKISKTTGEVTGWSWSSTFGWMCWGATCADPALADTDVWGTSTPPEIVGYETTAKAVVTTMVPPNLLDTSTPENNSLRGWAKIIARGNNGWMKLSGTLESGGDGYSVYFDENTNQFNGWSWNCPKDEDPENPGQCLADVSIGWVAFSGKTLADFVDQGACPTGTNCTDYSYSVDEEGTVISKWYTDVIAPWLETQGGDIYGKEGFPTPQSGLKPPILHEGYNASYLIHSDGTISPQWQSACRAAGGGDSCGPNEDLQTPKTSIGPFASPNSTNTYRNQLGFLNIDALIDTTIISGGKNKYGYKVISIGDYAPVVGHDPQLSTAQALDNTVLFRDGDLNIGLNNTDDPLTFYNGSPSASSGAGTIVVRGDLHIRTPIFYETSAITAPVSIKRTPSIAWVVIKRTDGTGGNIIIDDCVPPIPGAGPALLSGAYIAEGKISTGHGASSKGDQGSLLSSNCPSSSFGVNDIPLQVNGIMMAHEFNFQRVYTGNDTGSESIRDDGRLIANPPPGLADLAKTLPIWRSNRLSP